MRSRAMPASSQAPRARQQKVAHFGHDVVVARRRLHRARLALHVHEADADVALARTASIAPGSRSAATSLTIAAPAAIAARMTAGLRVSTRPATPSRRERFDERQHARELLVFGDRRRRRDASIRRRCR